jgi:hypothetical protein
MRFCFPCAAELLALLCLSSASFGSTIVSSVSQDSLYVGDRVRLDVVMLVPRGGQVAPPATENGFGRLSVKEWNSDKVEKKNADSLTFRYAVTTYTTEPCTIPALDFVMTKENAPETLRTPPFPLRVLLVSSPDTASIKDLKPQQNAGRPSLWWLWALLAALGAAVAVILVRRFFPKYGRPQPAVPPKPPYEEAMEALRSLESKQYLLKGLVREFVFELSDILKRYIERSFGINAAEFTAEEMLAWLGISPLDKSRRASMEWFFRAADPVKFAKYLPEQKSIDRFIVEARGFLEATRPRETVLQEASEDGLNETGAKPTASGAQKKTGGAG